MLMAVTLGVMLQFDRGPAAAVPPPQPVIEGTVISKSSQPIQAITQSSANNLNNAPNKPKTYYQTYNPSGEQKSMGGQTGTRLDIFV